MDLANMRENVEAAGIGSSGPPSPRAGRADPASTMKAANTAASPITTNSTMLALPIPPKM
jgi:hypothetical protein